MFTILKSCFFLINYWSSVVASVVLPQLCNIHCVFFFGSSVRDVREFRSNGAFFEKEEREKNNVYSAVFRVLRKRGLRWEGGKKCEG